MTPETKKHLIEIARQTKPEDLTNDQYSYGGCHCGIGRFVFAHNQLKEPVNWEIDSSDAYADYAEGVLGIQRQARRTFERLFDAAPSDKRCFAMKEFAENYPEDKAPDLTEFQEILQFKPLYSKWDAVFAEFISILRGNY